MRFENVETCVRSPDVGFGFKVWDVKCNKQNIEMRNTEPRIQNPAATRKKHEKRKPHTRETQAVAKQIIEKSPSHVGALFGCVV